AFAPVLGSVTLPATTGTIPNGPSTPRSRAAVLVNLGQQTSPVLTAAPAAPAAGAAGTDREPSSLLVPGLQPPVPRVEGGGGGGVVDDEKPEEVPVERRPPEPDPSGPLGAPPAAEELGTLSGLRARDACFADGSWMANAAASSG